MKYIPLITLLASIAVVPVVSAQNPSDAMKEARQNALANKAKAGAARRQQAGAVRNQTRQRSANPQARQRNANPGFVRTGRGTAGRSFVNRNRTIPPTASVIRPNVNRPFTGNGSQRSGNVDVARRYRNFDRGNRANRGSNFNATNGDLQENQSGRGNVRGNRPGGDREGFRASRGSRQGNWDRNHRNGGDRERFSAHRGGRHHNWDRSRRNRSWWRNHYSRFALFGGGYYYWNAGSWYPAYGYDPYFSTYVYDAPIYGYNNLEPGEVIARVQAELQRLGYDTGSVDGDFGPATREALVAYQQDNGLSVTGEIDEDTLSALGLE